MVWALISLIVILGIGIPIIQNIYNTLLNTTNGSWLNWTVENATGTGYLTPYSDVEYATFRFMPLLAALMALVFILVLLGGFFKRRREEAGK